MSARSYNGVPYRSLLEVRWVVCLETLGLPVHYEPASYVIPGGLYVPDLWLPAVQHFLEIKPEAPKPEAISKATRLFHRYKRPVFFLCGFPNTDTRLHLTNCALHWHDGHVLGPGMSIATKLCYVLGLPETEAMAQHVALAVQHARTVTRRQRDAMEHELTAVRGIVAQISWPKIVDNLGGRTR